MYALLLVRQRLFQQRQLGTRDWSVKVGNLDQVRFYDGIVRPTADNDIDLGTTSVLFKNIYAYTVDAAFPVAAAAAIADATNAVNTARKRLGKAIATARPASHRRPRP